MKKLFKTTILAAGLVLFTGCLDDLNQYPSLEKTPEDVYSSMEGYRSVIAKCYASFVIAGQELGGGNPDINGNNNYDYLRCTSIYRSVAQMRLFRHGHMKITFMI